MNRARLIFNLILVLGLAALGAALWLTHAPQPEPEPTVSDMPIDSIQRAAVHLDETTLQLARTDDGAWRLEAPVDARANAVHVRTLLDLAAARPQRRLDREAIAAEAIGLDPRRLAVRFNDAAPILIGAPGPQPGTYYVATPHALLIVELQSLARLPASWRGWVSPTLLGDSARLTRLTLPRLTLERSDTGGWQVEPSAADRGADYAQATIDAWRNSRALSLEPVDASRARIARITLRFEDAPTRHLDVIAREPELILRDERLGIDYHFAAHLAAPLLDMQHPETLGAGRARDLQSSAIPLDPTGGRDRTTGANE